MSRLRGLSPSRPPHPAPAVRPCSWTWSLHAPTAAGRGTVLVDGAPARPQPAGPAAASVGATGLGSARQPLGALSAIIINRELVVTTAAGRAGVLTMVAHSGRRLLGSCSNVTRGGVGVTCRLALRGSSRSARIRVSAVLRSGHRVLAARRVAGVPLPTMKMLARLPGLKGGVSAAFAYICSPTLRIGGPAAIRSLP